LFVCLIFRWFCFGFLANLQIRRPCFRKLPWQPLLQVYTFEVDFLMVVCREECRSKIIAEALAKPVELLSTLTIAELSARVTKAQEPKDSDVAKAVPRAMTQDCARQLSHLEGQPEAAESVIQE